MGVQWAPVLIEQCADARQARLSIRFPSKVAAVICAGGVGEQFVHAPRAHVDVPFVRMEPEALVPVDAVQPQRERHGQNDQQHIENPGDASAESQEMIGPKGQSQSSTPSPNMGCPLEGP